MVSGKIAGRLELPKPQFQEIFEKRWNSVFTLLQKADPTERRQMIQTMRAWLDELENLD